MTENYDYVEHLRGQTFWRSSWVRPHADWDHDHCAVCWANFSEAPELNEGYTTGPDHKHGARYEWVCETCFNKLRDRMGWSVGSAQVVSLRP